MKRKMVVSLVSFSLVLAFSACLNAATYKPEYKLSLVTGPKGPWGESAQKFADLVKERSGGKINIKCYFSGQLFAGMQTTEFLLLRQGVADFAVGSTINWSPTVKELNLFNLPFLIPSYKALDAIESGEAGKKVFKIIEEKGVLGLGWGENGFREITNSKRPIRKPEDLEGLKVRVVGSPIFVDIFRALGANPMSINWAEALTAFQQGTADGQENPIISVIIPYKLWEFHKHITLWHYTIDPQILGVSKLTWDGFNPQDRELISRAALEAMAWNKKESRHGLEGSTEGIDLLKSKGMEVIILSPKDMEPFKVKTKSVYDKWIKEIGADLVDTAEKTVRAVSN